MSSKVWSRPLCSHPSVPISPCLPSPLASIPRLAYIPCLPSLQMNYVVFLQWFLNGVVHSAVCLHIPSSSYPYLIQPHEIPRNSPYNPTQHPIQSHAISLHPYVYVLLYPPTVTVPHLSLPYLYYPLPVPFHVSSPSRTCLTNPHRFASSSLCWGEAGVTHSAVIQQISWRMVSLSTPL